MEPTRFHTEFYGFKIASKSAFAASSLLISGSSVSESFVMSVKMFEQQDMIENRLYQKILTTSFIL